MQMFRYLSYKELVRVSNIAEMIELQGRAGRSSARASPATRCTSCSSGSVRLTKGDKVVAELGKGQHFGEMALVDRSVRSLTATAAEAHAPGRDHAQGLLRDHQARARARVKMLWSFVQVLGQRLRKTTNDLSDALHGDRHGRRPRQENLFQD